MASASIIVFEKRRRWAPELQRQFAGANVRVRACRSIGDILPNVQEAPENVVVLDLQAGPAECLQFLGRRVGVWPFLPVIVIGCPHSADLEWPVRELGAVEFISDFASGDDVARLCRRQFSSFGQHAGD